MLKNIFAATGFVLAFNLLLYNFQFGINFGVLILFLNIFYFLTRNKEVKELNLAVAFSTLSTLFAFGFGFRDSGVVQVVNTLATAFFTLSAFYLYKSESPFEFKILKALLMPVQSVLETILATTVPRRKVEATDRISSEVSSALTKGLIIAAPLIFILFLLLSSADPIFARLADLLLKDIKGRLFTSVVILIYLLITTRVVILDNLGNSLEEKLDQLKKGKFYELVVILGNVLTLFSVFLFVQFKYLFNKVAEVDLSSIGVNSQTYSEYVRRGFFELLIVCAIVTLVVVYILRFLHHLQSKQKMILQWLSGFMIIETGLILSSAYQRVHLYVEAHGLTRARGFGLIFFAWLLFMLLILLIEVVKKQRPRYIFLSTAFITVLALLLFNLLDVDGMMATRFKPTVNGEVDYYYLTELSTDAYPTWLELIQQAEPIIVNMESKAELNTEDGRKIFYLRWPLDKVKRKVDYLKQKYNSNSVKKHWQEFRLSEYLAYQFLLEHQADFAKVESLIQRANTVDNKIMQSVRNGIQYDRSLNAPLR